MGLPVVKITINNDRLGQTNQTDDTVAGMILTGATVAGADNVTLGTPVKLTSLEDAEAIGILATGTNAYAHSQIKDFYLQGLTGATLWILLVASTVTMADMLDKDEDHAPAILDAAKGAIRYLAVSRKSAAGITVANGVDEDVDAAVTNGQVLADAYVALFKYLKVIVDVKDFNGNQGDLKNYKTATKNRVAGLISGTSGKNAAVGLLLGRIASNPVQRSPGRVKDGELPIDTATFTDGEAVETLESSWGAIHDKGYILLRTIPGRSGYFFSGAPTFTQESDDLNRLQKVAVIDKAALIALSVFTDYINDEIPLEASGKISPAIIANWRADIENAIDQQMTANGEISGCKAPIDPNQDVLGTNTLNITLDILPVGYSESIQIDLGFTTSLTE